MTIIIPTVSFLEPFSQISPDIFAGSPEAADLEKKARSYTEAFEGGQITSAEYRDLLLDLKVDQMVINNTNDIRAKELLSELVSNLFALLGSIALIR